MRLKQLLAAMVVMSAFAASAAPQIVEVRDGRASDIGYFIPGEGHSYDKAVPTPKEFLGFEIGENYLDWGMIQRYYEALAATSERSVIRKYGQTYQHRDFFQIIITSPENQGRLEELRQLHLSISDTGVSADLDLEKVPLVVDLLGSIHGNEPSGVNAALIAAYHFSACTDPEVEEMLKETIVIVTPGQNPDGINRYATWINTTRSFQPYPDLSHRSFSEVWVSSRSNHYFADENRDWLAVQHPECQNDVRMFLDWLPNVVSDLHEQSGRSNKGYYYSPGHPLRTHHLVSDENQLLQEMCTDPIGEALDQVGARHYSKQGYDDYYLGKGAAYGDIHGGISFLCEQPLVHGFLRPTDFGPISFDFSIRNQSFSAIATVMGAWRNKSTLLDYQRRFFQDADRLAAEDEVKGYVFRAPGDNGKMREFLKILDMQELEVYRLSKDLKSAGKNYPAEDSYLLPLGQKYYHTARAIMEDLSTFSDSTFYDISTWTFPRAFGLEYDELSSVEGLRGERVRECCIKPAAALEQSQKGYFFDNRDFNTPKFLNALLSREISVKATAKGFYVEVENQKMDAGQLHRTIAENAIAAGIKVVPTEENVAEDALVLDAPKSAILTGGSFSTTATGEIWYLFDRRFDMPLTLIESSKAESVDFGKYNVIIMADGAPNPAFSEKTINKLVRWINDGGRLIVTGKGVNNLEKLGIADIKSSTNKRKGAGASVSGVILNNKLDSGDPLSWGYQPEQPERPAGRKRTKAVAVTPFIDIQTIKLNSTVYSAPEDMKVVMRYDQNPCLSGCLSNDNSERFSGAPVIMRKEVGEGSVIFFADNLNFRSFWLGTTKLFMNAVFLR